VGVFIAIHSHHKPVTAPAAPVLCVQAPARGIDIPEEFPRGSAQWAYHSPVIEPAAAPATLVDFMRPRAGSDDVFGVVPAPAEGAGSRCVLPGVIRRVRCLPDPI